MLKVHQCISIICKPPWDCQRGLRFLSLEPPSAERIQTSFGGRVFLPRPLRLPDPRCNPNLAEDMVDDKF